jgi:hypothetical protein
MIAMKRRRSRAHFHEPSLVPLADMLTNTVGIMVFILIFTVLTAGGVVVVKRLPMEQRTEARPLHFLCTKGRILPLNLGPMTNQFLEPLGKPGSYDAVAGWIKKFNARQVEDEFFVAKGEGEAHYSDNYFSRSVELELAVAFTPRDGQGETIEEMKKPNSRFRQTLQSNQPKDRFAYFIVQSDSLDLFAQARSVAIRELGFGYGWMPLKAGEPVRVALTGTSGGYTPTTQ